MPAQADPRRPHVPSGRRGELAALAAVGALSALPPYLGGALGLELDVPAAVEVVDHAIPGAVAVAAALAALRIGRREPDTLLLVLIGAAFLAGLWQVTSHVPLVLDAGEPLRPWDAVLLHAIPGLSLAGFSLFLLLRPS